MKRFNRCVAVWMVMMCLCSSCFAQQKVVIGILEGTSVGLAHGLRHFSEYKVRPVIDVSPIRYESLDVKVKPLQRIGGEKITSITSSNLVIPRVTPLVSPFPVQRYLDRPSLSKERECLGIMWLSADTLLCTGLVDSVIVDMLDVEKVRETSLIMPRNSLRLKRVGEGADVQYVSMGHPLMLHGDFDSVVLDMQRLKYDKPTSVSYAQQQIADSMSILCHMQVECPDTLLLQSSADSTLVTEASSIPLDFVYKAIFHVQGKPSCLSIRSHCSIHEGAEVEAISDRLFAMGARIILMTAVGLERREN